MKEITGISKEIGEEYVNLKKILKDLSRKSSKCFVFIEQYKNKSGDSLTNG
jgi:hypothetical protein